MENLTPITRVEHFLQEIIDNGGGGVGGGGGGGTGGGVLIVNMNMATMALDKTFADIRDADFPLIKIAVPNGTQIGYVTQIYATGGSYGIQAVVFNNDGTTSPALFLADSEDDYPVMSM